MVGSPLFRQWQAAKEKYPDVLVMFRMGGYYEFFGDDALTVAPLLGLRLTMSDVRGFGVVLSMCGVPAHGLRRYLRQLIDLGHRVAVCEESDGPTQVVGEDG